MYHSQRIPHQVVFSKTLVAILRLNGYMINDDINHDMYGYIASCHMYVLAALSRPGDCLLCLFVMHYAIHLADDRPRGPICITLII